MIKKQMKRFYKDANLVSDGNGFGVSLDGRRLKTPAGAELSVPTQLLATKIVDEWAAVDVQIELAKMPFFSASATVIDRVFPQMQTLRAELADYARAELICYRASDDDAELLAHQRQHWDSWLDWMQEEYQIGFHCTQGIMPVAQPEAAIARAEALMDEVDGWSLSVLYRSVQLSSSFVLSWAFLQGRLDAGALFEASCLDELFQNQKWGLDYEAETRQNNIRAELQDIEAFFTCLRA